MTVYETCEDREYLCCDLTPLMTDEREGPDEPYDSWYDRHVDAWQVHHSAVRAGKRSAFTDADPAEHSDDDRPAQQ